jgi:glycosyltransferase involved in cell wall biosynthesis
VSAVEAAAPPMTAPLVSVLVPARDAERFLGEALASALAQDLPLELLVCDDGSRDRTGAIAERFAVRDRRVRVLRHERPRGVAAARNALLASASGRYVAWLDADDAYLAGGLPSQVARLEAEPGVALVHGAATIVGEDGRELAPFRRPFEHDAIEPGPRAFAELLLANELVTSTVVVRRSAHLAAGRFAEVGPSSSDWDMWLRLALQGDVAYRAEPVARYRQHPASISHRASVSGARLRCDARVVRRALRISAAHGCAKPHWSGNRARSALAAKALLQAGDLRTRGERRASLRALALAVHARPALALAAHDRAGDPPATLMRLARATARGDDYAAHRIGQALLDRLAGALAGTRYGDALAKHASSDRDWEAALRRIARAVQRVTPSDAVLGTVTKWDPTLLRLSGRRGRNFPDRATLPDGYPPDSAAAVAHLEQQRAQGLSHLVFPQASLWWLDHYAGLAQRLRAAGPPVHEDDDCVVFDLRTAGAPA